MTVPNVFNFDELFPDTLQIKPLLWLCLQVVKLVMSFQWWMEDWMLATVKGIEEYKNTLEFYIHVNTQGF